VFQKLFATSNDLTLTVLRALLAVVFFPHGAQKLLGLFGGGGLHGTLALFARMGLPTFLGWLVIVTEFFGPLALLFGFLTRIAALAIGVDMLSAVLLVHIHIGFFMNWTGQQKGEGFEFHLLALAIVIVLLVRGAGALSLDRLIARRAE
jgi:putative oxidoreductase